MDMKALMRQAQQMQAEMAKTQEEIGKKVFEASAGGGMVTVKVNGKHEVLAVAIDKSIVSADDTSMLEDLVVAATNEAIKQANDAMHGAFSGMMGGGGLGALKNMF